MTDSGQFQLHAGTVLGRYELLLPVAKGGMAQVWAAQLHGTRGFQKLVAVKTILANVMDNTRMEQMFLEEAQLASQVHHSNVVQTLELGEHEGTLYLVMEWVDGEPLNRVMARAATQGGLPLPIAVNLIGQACKGLQAAHDLRDDSGALLGVVHRDVSPQNLLVGFSGTAKLVDFGIAKVTARSSGLTEAGEVKGKFAYMAPEQVRGHVVDRRTDLFALGILLYSVTTGKHPFRGENPAETLQNLCSAAPPAPPSSFLPDYPNELEEVVMKAIAKQPDQRFDSATDMLEALQLALPEALATGFDTDVAEYMKTLFGPVASERRAAIRLAQKEAERHRADAGASSVGTLRAISINQHEGGQFSLTPTPGPAAPPAHLEPSPLAGGRRWAGAALGAAAVLTLGIVFQLTRTPGTSASASASSPVPRDLATLERPEAPAASAAAPASVAQAASAQPTASVEPASSAERARKAPRGARPVAAAIKPSSSPVATPAPAAGAAAPSKVEPQTAPSTNAWDRGAFGGRH